MATDLVASRLMIRNAAKLFDANVYLYEFLCNINSTTKKKKKIK